MAEKYTLVGNLYFRYRHLRQRIVVSWCPGLVLYRGAFCYSDPFELPDSYLPCDYPFPAILLQQWCGIDLRIPGTTIRPQGTGVDFNDLADFSDIDLGSHPLRYLFSSGVYYWN